MLRSNPSEPKALKKFWSREIRRYLLLDAWCFVLYFTILIIFYRIENFVGFGDSPLYIDESNTLFQKQSVTDQASLNSTQEHFVYPLYPLYLRIVSSLCFGSKWLSLPLSAFLLTLTGTLAFHTFLHAYAKLEHPFDSLILSMIFPFAFQVERYTINPEILFFIEICYFMYFLYRKQKIKALIICFLAVFTKDQGIYLVIIFIMSYLLSKNMKKFAFSLTSLLSLALLAYYHNFKYNDPFISFKIIFSNFSIIPFSGLTSFIKESTVYFFSVFILCFLFHMINSVFVLAKETFPLFLLMVLVLFEMIFTTKTNFEYNMGAIVVFCNSFSFIRGYEKNKYIKGDQSYLLLCKFIITLILPVFVAIHFAGLTTVSQLMKTS